MNYYSEECWGYPEKESGSAAPFIFDAESANVRLAVIKAFHEWPLNADERRNVITKALDRLDDAMEHYYTYSKGESGQQLLLYAGICAASNLNERGTVEDGISDYIGFWKGKL